MGRLADDGSADEAERVRAREYSPCLRTATATISVQIPSSDRKLRLIAPGAIERTAQSGTSYITRQRVSL